MLAVMGASAVARVLESLVAKSALVTRLRQKRRGKADPQRADPVAKGICTWAPERKKGCLFQGNPLISLASPGRFELPLTA